jgi:hypothetical protein
MFFLVAGIALIFKNPVASETELIWSFITAYLFFDSTHVLFTFIFLFTLPEAKNLFRDSLKSRRTWIFTSLFLCVFLPLFFVLKRHNFIGPWAVDILFTIPLFLFARHSIRQIFGISMLYNVQAQYFLDRSERERIASVEKRERKLLGFFVAAWVLYVFCKQTSLKVFHLESIPLYAALFLLGIFFCMLTQYRGVLWRNKKIYLVRLLLFPLAFFSPLGMMGVAAVHGTEYLFVVWNLISKSVIGRKRLLMSLLPITATLILAPRVLQDFSETDFYTAKFYENWSHLSKEIIFVVYMTVQYLHYYVDGLLFRLKDPLVQKHMGPLLGIKKL